MIVVTPAQATRVAALISKALKKDFDAADVEHALSALAAALNEGLVLSSGDGFRYHLKKSYGLLTCHDGSVLKGSLAKVLEKSVWGIHKLADVVDSIDNLGVALPNSLLPTTRSAEHLFNSIQQELVACGYAIESRTALRTVTG